MTIALRSRIRRRSFWRQYAEAAADASPPRSFACVTNFTAVMWRRSRASSAAGCRAKRITYVSHSLGLWDGRSPTNTPSRSADFTIANSTDMATKPRGGRESTSIPCRSPLTFGDNQGDSRC